MRSPGLDPICGGCRIELHYDEIPEVDRFRGEWMSRAIGQEALVWQLDILAAGIERMARERWLKSKLAKEEETREFAI